MTLQTKTNWRQLNVTVTQTVAKAGLVAQEKETEKRCFFSEPILQRIGMQSLVRYGADVTLLSTVAT